MFLDKNVSFKEEKKSKNYLKKIIRKKENIIIWNTNPHYNNIYTIFKALLIIN